MPASIPATPAMMTATSEPSAPKDTPAAALGRRTLSTAFVMVGPDGLLTVGLRGGRTMVLRDVVMGASDYCGQPVPALKAGKRYCGRYEEIVAARPGGGR